MLFQVLSIFLFLPCLIFAAVVPFSLDGIMDSATADTGDYNTGGKITVGGLTITIPKNLQFQFSAAWVGFKEIAAGGYTGNEVAINGNYVDGVAIAAQVQISQLLVAGNSGVIKSLDFDGKITLESGQVVRINDPNAVYSAGYTSKPAYTADDQNPSITAFSGFPMCVPRSASDPLCPSSNRPAGKRVFDAPDPLVMAPFIPGDYITFSGIKVADEIIAYSISSDNVQITTTGTPAYIRVEDAIIGTFDTQSPANVAPADSRFIGYVSDSTVNVIISRIDIDPCTGEQSYVEVGSARPIGVRNKWTWRSTSSTLVKYAREYRVTTSSGTKDTNLGQKNPIVAGQYVAPVTEWIFPEQGFPGNEPGKLDFTNFGHLVNGIGPDADGNVWGQLEPFPDAKGVAPAPKACTATTPTSSAPAGTGTDAPASSSAPALAANAGPDVSSRPGVVVTLKGAADNAASPPSGDLTYSWTQIAGPTVTLTGGAKPTASFTAPAVSALTSYSFNLTVTSASTKQTSTDTVIVTNDPKAVDSVVIDVYTTTTQKGGTIAITAHSNVVDGSAKLTVQINNAGAALTMTAVAGSPGKFTYNNSGIKAPANGITVTSSLGGKAAKTTTTSKRRRSWTA